MNLEIIEAVKVIANEELRHSFANVTRMHKDDGSFLTEADIAVQSRIQALLQENYLGIGFLGEEMSVVEQQAALQNPQGVWILDPLDGTSNFSAGIPYYAVSLAYIKQGKIEWGMVYDPERDECFSATRGSGAQFNDKPLLKPTADISIENSTAVIDFKRLNNELAARIASQPPYSSQRSLVV